MALITCPQCGQSVSDSAATCIHCGCKLKKEPGNFYDLPPVKQLELQNEYCLSGGTFPQDYATVHMPYANKLRLYIMFIIYLILAVIGAIWAAAASTEILILTIAVIPLCIIGIIAFLLKKIIKKHKNIITKMVENRIDFEEWLKNTHNVTITWDWGSSEKYYLEYKQIKQNRGIK